MTPEEIDNECNYLFNQNTAPIAFNGLESSELDVAIMKSLVDQAITVPVLHVDGNQYFIGTSVQHCELKKQGPMVKINDYYEPFGQYCIENHEKMEKILVQHMFESGKSLEEVCEQIINGRKIRTETFQKELQGSLRNTNWVSIEKEQSRGDRYFKIGGRFVKEAPKVNKQKTNVNVISPLSKQRKTEPVLIYENKAPQKTTKDRKYLTDLTKNYYGEDRENPIRVY